MASEQGDDYDDSHIPNEEDTAIMPWDLLKQRDYHFEGTTDPDVYFEWEHKMNEFFISCNFLEFEKVFIAAAQLIEQAQQWWTRESTKGCQTWEEMRNRMRKQYVPRDHYQKIRRQFRTLHQGDETIMEYYRKFTYLRIRLNPGVSNEDIMDQFVYGLSAQIRFELQSQAYTNLEELYEQTAQAEQDLRTNPFEEGEYDEVIKPIAELEVNQTHHSSHMEPSHAQKSKETYEPCNDQKNPTINCSILGNTWTTFLAQPEDSLKLNHPKISFHDGDIQFSSWVIPSLPELDLGTLFEGLRPNHVELRYEPSGYEILTHNRLKGSWIHAKTSSGWKVIQVLNRRILGLPYLEPWRIKPQQSRLCHYEDVIKLNYIIHNIPKAHHFLPKLSRYKEPPKFPYLANNQEIMAISIKSLIDFLLC